MAARSVIEPSLSIGEVAARSGVRSSAIRFYEAAGVLPPAPRTAGRRRFSEQTVDLLLLIRFCQRLGFTLDEVKLLLAAPDGHAGKRRWRELVDVKRDEVDRLIEQAQAVRALLDASRDCDCVDLAACDFVHAGRSPAAMAPDA